MRRAIALALLAIVGCRGPANVADSNLPKEPPAPALSAIASASASAEADAAAPPAFDPAADLPKLRLVLDDPRLAQARERERVRDWLAAARAVDDARKTATLTASEDCAWSYVAARLHQLAGSSYDAANAYDRVAGAGADGGLTACPLASYAALRAGEAYAKLSRWDDAAARLRAVSDDVAARDEAKLALAEALAAKNDRAGAIAIWRNVLAAAATPRWAETSARLAAALVDGGDGPAEQHAKEAFDLATRVVADAPKLAEALGAPQTRARAFTLLKAQVAAASDALSREERARQAQAWLDASDPQHAFQAADALLATMPRPVKEAKDIACKAAIVRAQAATRTKTKGDVWGHAISYCDGDDGLATALYFGGKASHAAHRTDEARDRFAKVEQLFPKHKYADDARFQQALIAQENGDEAKYVALLSSLPDAYPDGDLRSEALFRVGFLKYTRGEYDAAKAVFDRAVAIDASDRHWATAGRSAYFRARIAQLSGDANDAKARFARVIADFPLAYYMALAYSRLASIDRAAAESAMSDAVAREPDTRFFTREHSEVSDPAFERALSLLAVGEIEAARRELQSAKLLGDGADGEVLWVVARLFDEAGAPEIGHSFSRARLTDHLAHYPSGRWRVAWEAAFPRAFAPIVEKESKTYGIPVSLTWAIMREESGFHPEIRSPSNAHGLMQLLPSTAREVARGTGLAADETSLHHPEVNVPLGAKLLAALRRSFPGNPALAIAAYNSGSGSVRRWLDARGNDELDVFVEQIPFDETRGYVKRVLASQAAYAFLYARPTLDEVLSLPARARGGG